MWLNEIARNFVSRAYSAMFYATRDFKCGNSYTRVSCAKSYLFIDTAHLHIICCVTNQFTEYVKVPASCGSIDAASRAVWWVVEL